MAFALWNNQDDSRPRTHNALVEFYNARFQTGLKQGEFQPYIWPYRSFGVYLMLAYMLCPPTQSRLFHYARYPVFAFMVYWSVLAMVETKSACHPLSYGIGLVDAWAVLWVGSLVIFRDFWKLRRIERRGRGRGEGSEAGQGVDVGVATSSRLQDQGTKARLEHENGIPTSPGKQNRPHEDGSRYYWQSFPQDFLTRLDFVTDLIGSMRGPGWEHQARSIPSPPKHIAQDLSPPPRRTKPVSRGYSDVRPLLQSNILRLLRFYATMDLIKTLMSVDEYFLGLTTPPPPAPAFLPSLIRASPALTKWYRLLLSMIMARTALGFIFSLSPIFFAGILGPRVMGLRAEPWYYADFGGPFSHLWTGGLAGWWGAWWHQIFRLGFEAPAEWACTRLGWSPRSAKGKLLGVCVAFLCSAFLHACGSVTLLPATRPLAGPVAFFVLQGCGVVGEAAVCGWFKKRGVSKSVPLRVRHAVTFAWVALWMYYTAPLLIDDFSRGGIWLFEPVPVSLLRGLGYGDEERRWWRWRGRNVFWHSADRWWRSGIAV